MEKDLRNILRPGASWSEVLPQLRELGEYSGTSTGTLEEEESRNNEVEINCGSLCIANPAALERNPHYENTNLYNCPLCGRVLKAESLGHHSRIKHKDSNVTQETSSVPSTNTVSSTVSLSNSKPSTSRLNNCVVVNRTDSPECSNSRDSNSSDSVQLLSVTRPSSSQSLSASGRCRTSSERVSSPCPPKNKRRKLKEPSPCVIESEPQPSTSSVCGSSSASTSSSSVPIVIPSVSSSSPSSPPVVSSPSSSSQSPKKDFLKSQREILSLSKVITADYGIALISRNSSLETKEQTVKTNRNKQPEVAVKVEMETDSDEIEVVDEISTAQAVMRRYQRTVGNPEEYRLPREELLREEYRQLSNRSTTGGPPSMPVTAASRKQYPHTHPSAPAVPPTVPRTVPSTVPRTVPSTVSSSRTFPSVPVVHTPRVPPLHALPTVFPQQLTVNTTGFALDNVLQLPVYVSPSSQQNGPFYTQATTTMPQSAMLPIPYPNHMVGQSMGVPLGYNQGFRIPMDSSGIGDHLLLYNQRITLDNRDSERDKENGNWSVTPLNVSNRNHLQQLSGSEDTVSSSSEYLPLENRTHEYGEDDSDDGTAHYIDSTLGSPMNEEEEEEDDECSPCELNIGNDVGSDGNSPIDVVEFSPRSTPSPELGELSPPVLSPHPLQMEHGQEGEGSPSESGSASSPPTVSIEVDIPLHSSDRCAEGVTLVPIVSECQLVSSETILPIPPLSLLSKYDKEESMEWLEHFVSNKLSHCDQCEQRYHPGLNCLSKEEKKDKVRELAEELYDELVELDKTPQLEYWDEEEEIEWPTKKEIVVKRKEVIEEVMVKIPEMEVVEEVIEEMIEGEESDIEEVESPVPFVINVKRQKTVEELEEEEESDPDEPPFRRSRGFKLLDSLSPSDESPLSTQLSLGDCNMENLQVFSDTSPQSSIECCEEITSISGSPMRITEMDSSPIASSSSFTASPQSSHSLICTPSTPKSINMLPYSPLPVEFVSTTVDYSFQKKYVDMKNLDTVSLRQPNHYRSSFVVLHNSLHNNVKILQGPETTKAIERTKSVSVGSSSFDFDARICELLESGYIECPKLPMEYPKIGRSELFLNEQMEQRIYQEKVTKYVENLPGLLGSVEPYWYNRIMEQQMKEKEGSRCNLEELEKFDRFLKKETNLCQEIVRRYRNETVDSGMKCNDMVVGLNGRMVRIGIDRKGAHVKEVLPGRVPKELRPVSFSPLLPPSSDTLSPPSSPAPSLSSRESLLADSRRIRSIKERSQKRRKERENIIKMDSCLGTIVPIMHTSPSDSIPLKTFEECKRLEEGRKVMVSVDEMMSLISSQSSMTKETFEMRFDEFTIGRANHHVLYLNDGNILEINRYPFGGTTFVLNVCHFDDNSVISCPSRNENEYCGGKIEEEENKYLGIGKRMEDLELTEEETNETNVMNCVVEEEKENRLLKEENISVNYSFYMNMDWESIGCTKYSICERKVWYKKQELTVKAPRKEDIRKPIELVRENKEKVEKIIMKKKTSVKETATFVVPKKPKKPVPIPRSVTVPKYVPEIPSIPYSMDRSLPIKRRITQMLENNAQKTFPPPSIQSLPVVKKSRIEKDIVDVEIPSSSRTISNIIRISEEEKIPPSSPPPKTTRIVGRRPPTKKSEDNELPQLKISLVSPTPAPLLSPSRVPAVSTPLVSPSRTPSLYSPSRMPFISLPSPSSATSAKSLSARKPVAQQEKTLPSLRLPCSLPTRIEPSASSVSHVPSRLPRPSLLSGMDSDSSRETSPIPVSVPSTSRLQTPLRDRSMTPSLTHTPDRRGSVQRDLTPSNTSTDSISTVSPLPLPIPSRESSVCPPETPTRNTGITALLSLVTPSSRAGNDSESDDDGIILPVPKLPSYLKKRE